MPVGESGPGAVDTMLTPAQIICSHSSVSSQADVPHHISYDSFIHFDRFTICIDLQNPTKKVLCPCLIAKWYIYCYVLGVNILFGTNDKCINYLSFPCNDPVCSILCLCLWKNFKGIKLQWWKYPRLWISYANINVWNHQYFSAHIPTLAFLNMILLLFLCIFLYLEVCSIPCPCR